MYIELIGYLGSLLVVISMLMTSVVKLRVINMIGSMIFTGYALAIHSYPTAAMNLCLVLINMFNLYKVFRGKREYTIVDVSSEDVFVRYFLDSNAADIKKFFPRLDTALPYDYVYLICHHTEAAGLFLATTESDGVLNIKLDYVNPAYRDSSVGTYLYKRLSVQHVTKCVLDNPSDSHRPYLKKMGFSEQNGRWVREL